MQKHNWVTAGLEMPGRAKSVLFFVRLCPKIDAGAAAGEGISICSPFLK
jgi:hypothetical protein